MNRQERDRAKRAIVWQHTVGAVMISVPLIIAENVAHHWLLAVLLLGQALLLAGCLAGEYIRLGQLSRRR